MCRSGLCQPEPVRCYVRAGRGAEGRHHKHTYAEGPLQVTILKDFSFNKESGKQAVLLRQIVDTSLLSVCCRANILGIDVEQLPYLKAMGLLRVCGACVEAPARGAGVDLCLPLPAPALALSLLSFREASCAGGGSLRAPRPAPAAHTSANITLRQPLHAGLPRRYYYINIVNLLYQNFSLVY